MEINATTLAIAAGAFLQPYVQEALLGARLKDRAALAVTWVLALAIALVATWLTGGLAAFVASVPHFTLLDPSPLVAYIAPKWTAELAIASGVFHFAPDRVGSVPTSPQAVAGTTGTS